jgi:hypothetical protein
VGACGGGGGAQAAVAVGLVAEQFLEVGFDVAEGDGLAGGRSVDVDGEFVFVAGGGHAVKCALRNGLRQQRRPWAHCGHNSGTNCVTLRYAPLRVFAARWRVNRLTSVADNSSILTGGSYLQP